MLNNAAKKNVSISATILNVLHNYFDFGLIKLFSDLYGAKFLNISTEPSFPYEYFLSIYLSIIPENHARGPS